MCAVYVVGRACWWHVDCISSGAVEGSTGKRHLSAWQIGVDYSVMIEAHREAKVGLEQAMATLRQSNEDIMQHGNGLMSTLDVACKHAMCALSGFVQVASYLYDIAFQCKIVKSMILLYVMPK